MRFLYLLVGLLAAALPAAAGQLRGQALAAAGGDGSWAAWGGWSEWADGSRQNSAGKASCVKSRRRQRRCSGAACVGSAEHVQTEVCVPVDGAWAAWSAWGDWSGGACPQLRTRTRSCSAPAAAHGGADCAGESQDEQERSPCVVDGGWSDWGDWSRWSPPSAPLQPHCKRARQRSRLCSSPPPAGGGKPCAGDGQQVQQDSCAPVDGGWAAWQPWGAWGAGDAAAGSTGCPQQRERRRSCSAPAPAHGGADCAAADGVQLAHRPCVAGQWGAWAAWGAWGKTPLAGGAACVLLRERSRACDSPAPSAGGADCIGFAKQSDSRGCPVDGVWQQWAAWTPWAGADGSADGCPQARKRQRVCKAAQHGGKPCAGDSRQTQHRACAAPQPAWSDWSPWTAWARPMGQAAGSCTQRRNATRVCLPRGAQRCAGGAAGAVKLDSRACPSLDGDWSPWGDWSDCSESDCVGIRQRTRLCNAPSPLGDGRDCAGARRQERQCNRPLGGCGRWLPHGCPTSDGDEATECHAAFAQPWSGWSACSRPCGVGQQDRYRHCRRLHACPGMSRETRACEVKACQEVWDCQQLAQTIVLPLAPTEDCADACRAVAASSVLAVTAAAAGDGSGSSAGGSDKAEHAAASGDGASAVCTCKLSAINALQQRSSSSSSSDAVEGVCTGRMPKCVSYEAGTRTLVQASDAAFVARGNSWTVMANGQLQLRAGHVPGWHAGTCDAL